MMIKNVIHQELNKCGIVSNWFDNRCYRLLRELRTCRIGEIVNAIQRSAKLMGNGLKRVNEDFLNEQHFGFVFVLFFLRGMHRVHALKEICGEVSSEYHTDFLFPNKKRSMGYIVIG